MRGHDVCMRVGPSWTQHGMAHAPTWVHTNVAKREGSWIKCPKRVSRSGIRRGCRILRGGDCNSPKWVKWAQFAEWAGETVARDKIL
jgi:hypothetical protein